MVKFLNNFTISLILVLIYSLCMIVFRLDGVSFSKLLLTSLLWISLIITVRSFARNFTKLKQIFPSFAFNLFLLNIFVNIIAVFRSFVFSDGSITTLFGNIFTSLALLTPFFVVFSFDKYNLRRVQKYFYTLIAFGLILYPFSLILSNLSDIIQLRILIFLFLPVMFLVTTIHSNKRMQKLLLLLASFLLFIVSIKMSNRTMMIRETMLFLSLSVIVIYKLVQSKFILRFYFLLIFIPFYLLKSSIDSGESAIQQYISVVFEKELTADTRTFLYLEVFEDLIKNDKLLFGKGANGTYYSYYFSIADGDSETRLTVEVGLLSVLLKTGLLGVILYLALIIIAIYNAFFRSSNIYVLGVGLMLFIHLILFFIENIVSYSSYNLFIWFFVGVCLSKELRNMNNADIKQIFNSKIIY